MCVVDGQDIIIEISEYPNVNEMSPTEYSRLGGILSGLVFKVPGIPETQKMPFGATTRFTKCTVVGTSRGMRSTSSRNPETGVEMIQTRNSVCHMRKGTSKNIDGNRVSYLTVL